MEARGPIVTVYKAFLQVGQATHSTVAASGSGCMHILLHIHMTLSALLIPFAAQYGTGFIKYDESEHCKDARVMPEVMLRQKDLMAVLSQGSKPFSKSVVRQEMQALHEHFAQTWKFKGDSEVADWLTTITRRICNAQSVIFSAKRKSEYPKWLKQVLGTEGDSNPAEAAKDSWEYGFDEETKCAWRRKVGASEPKDLAVAIVDAAGDQEPITARFLDGSSAQIHEITCKAYRDMLKNKRGEGTGVVWRGEHSKTSNALRVQIRADRGILMSLYEQGAQICQIPIDIFEEEEWKDKNRVGKATDPKKFATPNSAEARKAAEAFMVSIAKEYAADKIPKEDLYVHRDSQLAANGLSTGRKRKAADGEPTAKAKASALRKKTAASASALRKKPAASVPEASVTSGSDAEREESDDPVDGDELSEEPIDEQPADEQLSEEPIDQHQVMKKPASINVAMQVTMPTIDLAGIED